MKVLAHLCLTILVLGGNFAPGTGYGAWTGPRCPIHTVSKNPETADSQAGTSGSAHSCCKMSCCQQQPAHPEQSCCAVPKNAAVGEQPVSDTPVDDTCPCCPGSCCLAAVTTLFCILQTSISTGDEHATMISLSSDEFSTRRDEPALPPPRIWSA